MKMVVFKETDVQISLMTFEYWCYKRTIADMNTKYKKAYSEDRTLLPPMV